jgi:hypothetical protein
MENAGNFNQWMKFFPLDTTRNLIYIHIPYRPHTPSIAPVSSDRFPFIQRGFRLAGNVYPPEVNALGIQKGR